MTEVRADTGGTATGTEAPPRPRGALPALCVTQVTSWGVVFYAFPVLDPAITEDTGWGPARRRLRSPARFSSPR